MAGKFEPELEVVVQVLQASIVPAFMLAAIGALLNVLTTRLARIVDRSREIKREVRAGNRPAREFSVEVDWLIRRSKLVRTAMLLAVAAGMLICLVIALLFVMGLSALSLPELVAALFVIAMMLIAGSFCALLYETGFAGVQLTQLHDQLDNMTETDPKD